MLLKNARFILTPQKVLENQNILIENNEIKEIDSVSDKSGRVIDASNSVVMPGLINTHTHLSMTLFKGYGEDLPLQQWLQEKIWPIEEKLKDKHCYWASLLGLIEMIKTGTTCFNDLYFHMDETAKACEEVGVRALLARAVLDIDGLKGRFKDSERFIKNWKNSELITPITGPHAIYTCSEELLRKVKSQAEKYNTKIHIHLSETEKEVRDCLKEKGMRPTEYLEDIGLLSDKVIAAHSVHLNKKEIEILKRNDSSISHCPASNMKLASGVAPISKMLNSSLNVSIGSDGSGSNNSLNLFNELKIAGLLQKVNKMNAKAIKVNDLVKMATANGAKALGLNTGKIKEGKKADLIMINLNREDLKPVHRIKSNLIYSFNGQVDTSIINGKIVMKNRKILTLDEKKILDKVEEVKNELF